MVYFYFKKDGVSIEERNAPHKLLKPVMFVESNGKEEERSKSFFNRPEAAEIYLLVERLAADKFELNRIGVICMYQAQASLVRELLTSSRSLRKAQKKSDIDFGKVPISLLFSPPLFLFIRLECRQ